MEIKEFVKNFGNQFDDTDISEFAPDTRFRELEEWSSLVALAIMNMLWRLRKCISAIAKLWLPKPECWVYHL